MNYLYYLCLVLALGCTIEAQKNSQGSCPSIVPMANFNYVTFSTPNLWYEMSKYPNTNQTGNGCATWSFSGTAPSLSLTYTATVVVANTPGPFFDIVMPMTMPTASVGTLSGPFGWSSANLNVLDTDYTSYAVLYSCSEYKSFFKVYKNEYVWVLQRDYATAVTLPLTTIQTNSHVVIDTAFVAPTTQIDACYPTGLL